MLISVVRNKNKDILNVKYLCKDHAICGDFAKRTSWGKIGALTERMLRIV